MAKVVITLKLAKLFIPFCITELQKREEKHFFVQEPFGCTFFFLLLRTKRKSVLITNLKITYRHVLS